MYPVADGSSAAAFEPTAGWMVQGLVHGHPLWNGYSGFFPPGHRDQRERLARFPDADSVSELTALGVRFAVADARWWTSTRDREARALGLEVVMAGPDAVLLQLSGEFRELDPPD